jgi:tetratricopeptide (TPR) repeat protein
VRRKACKQGGWEAWRRGGMGAWGHGGMEAWGHGGMVARKLGRYCLLSTVNCLLFLSSYASFDFNANCQQAMQDIFDLKIKTAREILQKEKSANPQNGYVVYLEHYSECIELIATEDIKVYEKIINSYEERMTQMDRMDDGSPQNGWLQAEILFQTGLAQVKFGTRINGVYKMLSSYKRIKAHRQEYPDFWQNQKLTGMFNIILDNIPSFIRWAADIFGFSGDSGLGIYQLTEYGKKAGRIRGLAEESVIMTNLGYLLSKQEDEAFKFLAGQDPDVLNVVLVKYLYSNTASFVYRNDLTIKLLSEINPGKLEVSFYAIPYSLGRCKLNHLEKDARNYLEDFLNDYSVLDYKKAACNRLSYCYLLEGNVQKFEEYRAKVAAVGQEIRDRDQEAILESSDPLIPHTGLLKARLLCDGGYFSMADSVMKAINPVSLNQPEYQLEYYYRKGRIFQLTGKPALAIQEFDIAFNQGKTLPYTYATRSALQLGNIYEDQKDYRSANDWYARCIEVYSDSHTTAGVKDMAEKGEKRVKGKF